MILNVFPSFSIIFHPTLGHFRQLITCFVPYWIVAMLWGDHRVLSSYRSTFLWIVYNNGPVWTHKGSPRNPKCSEAKMRQPTLNTQHLDPFYYPQAMINSSESNISSHSMARWSVASWRYGTGQKPPWFVDLCGRLGTWAIGRSSRGIPHFFHWSISYHLLGSLRNPLLVDLVGCHTSQIFRLPYFERIVRETQKMKRHVEELKRIETNCRRK